MFDHFLTYILQIVIVLDVLGAIAYFALGALRKQKRATPSIELKGPSLWQRLFARSQPQTVPATDRDFARLQEVLYGFQVGLAK
jgi:hypothetical protein